MLLVSGKNISQTCSSKRQFGVQYDTKVSLFRNVFYWGFVKKYGWVIYWTSLFGEGHFNCLLSRVRIKGHSSFSRPKIDEVQIMVHVDSSCILIMDDSENRRIVGK